MSEFICEKRATHFLTVGKIFKSENGYYVEYPFERFNIRVPRITMNDKATIEEAFEEFNSELNRI